LSDLAQDQYAAAGLAVCSAYGAYILGRKALSATAAISRYFLRPS